MPKITKGGVSNASVDPDFIAEPGVSVERALDEGLPNVGQPEPSPEPEPEPDNEHPAFDTPKPTKSTTSARKK